MAEETDTTNGQDFDADKATEELRSSLEVGAEKADLSADERFAADMTKEYVRERKSAEESLAHLRSLLENEQALPEDEQRSGYTQLLNDQIKMWEEVVAVTETGIDRLSSLMPS